MGEARQGNSVLCVSTNNVVLPTEWTLDERALCDLELLCSGAFSPLDGYMDKATYNSVLDKMELLDGSIWPMPIVLAIPKTVTHILSNTENIANGPRVLKLKDSIGTIIASVCVSDVYEPDLENEMQKVLNTQDPNHPHVQHLRKAHKNCLYVGGKVTLIHKIQHFDFKEFRINAKDCRDVIKKNNWENVVGFQTRNPMHRSHFELTRQALAEVGDNAKLLLTPAVGPTQPGDVEYHIRVRCYKKLLGEYKKDQVKLVLLPLAMRMAGPREAVFHAIIRKNYGCTHFIVGRDHAGPSAKKQDGTSFYEPYEAHELLKSVQDKLGIKPIFGKNMVYIENNGGKYVQADQVPPNTQVKDISGTRLREMLQTREEIPSWYSFPGVVEELHKFYLPQHQRGFCMYFTGLPCAGKSTLATAIESKLRENENETRNITVLDADIIRTHLSKGLGFSREDRSLNIRRIGYVASEIVKHGGICLVANIAPYEEDRQYNRKLIESIGGGYIETHVSTPLSVCESRDVKELYKKARKGVIKQFTGISDPYEVPENPALVIDSTDDIDEKVQRAVDCLQADGWIR